MVSEMVLSTDVSDAGSAEPNDELPASNRNNNNTRLYTHSFFVSFPFDLGQLEGLLAKHLCQHYPGLTFSLKLQSSASSSHSLPAESVVVSLAAYHFDGHLLANVPADHRKLIQKVQLMISFATPDRHCHPFGSTVAYLRHLLPLLETANGALPPVSIRHLNDNFLNFTASTSLDIEAAYTRLLAFSSTNAQVATLVDTITEFIAQRMTSMEALCLSFNGGKDCTVLLHALVVLLYHHRRERPFEMLNLLLIETTAPFPEQELFIRRITTYFRCRLLTYKAADLKSALWAVKRNTGDRLKDIFMGVRRSDLPEAVRSSLTTTQLTDTDRGWPAFTRISPLLDWSYSDVWRYIRALEVPYCALYDYGYTSIGEPSNTVPNQLLKRKVVPEDLPFGSPSPAPEESCYYLPAYLLDEECTERSGSRVQ